MKRDPMRVCVSKKRFETESEAYAAARMSMKIYKCPLCQGFHHTSKGKVEASPKDAFSIGAPSKLDRRIVAIARGIEVLRETVE